MSADEAGIDEFIVDRDKVPLIERSREKIERMYQVHIGVDNVTNVGREPKQWLTVGGETGDRRNAKEYILAVCHPVECQSIHCPAHVTKDIETFEEIEKQTNAVIRLDTNGSKLEIAGTDLAVTLAMSSLEDLFRQSHQLDTEIVLNGSDLNNHSDILPEYSPGSMRLQATLQRALSEKSDGAVSVEDYRSAPDSVKRVILHCLNQKLEDEDIDDSQLFAHGMHTAGSENPTPQTFKVPVFGQNMQSDLEVDAVSNDATPITAADVGDLRRSSGGVGTLTDQFNVTNISSQTSRPVPLPKEHEYLIAFGLSVGYSRDEVNEAMGFVDEKTKPTDFLELLGGIKEKRQKQDVPSVDLSQAVDSVDGGPSPRSQKPNFPPPPQISPQTAAGGLAGGLGKSGSPFPKDYMQKLMQDFNEEGENLSREELKKRNEERQLLLRKAFDDQKGESSKPGKQTDADNSVTPKKPGWNFVGKKKKKGSQGQEKDLSKGRGRGSPQPNKDNKNRDRIGQGGSSSNMNPYDRSRYVDEHDEEETCVLKVWTTEDEASVHEDESRSKSRPLDFQPVHGIGQAQAAPIRESPRPRPHPQVVQHTHSAPIRQREPPHVPPSQALVSEDELRYIVIDGSNVAMTHGNGKIFSCRGIVLCVDYFLSRGHKQVSVFVPEWRKYNPRPENPISDQGILTQLKEQGHLYFTPSRRVAGKLISCYDDRFILSLAEKEDGIIVSNDQYRDLMREKYSWKTIIEERLLMYTFVGDNFMPPEDPLGWEGPKLDEFLSKPPRHPSPTRKRVHSPVKRNSWAGHDEGPVWNSQNSDNQPYGWSTPQNRGQQNALHVRDRGLQNNWNVQNRGQQAAWNSREGGQPNARNVKYGGQQNFGNVHDGGQQSAWNGGQQNFGNVHDGGHQSAWNVPNRGLVNGPRGPYPHQTASVVSGGRGGRGRGNIQRGFINQKPPVNTVPPRSPEMDEELFMELKTIFPEKEQEDKIRSVLQNHNTETDLTRLTNYCMNVLFS